MNSDFPTQDWQQMQMEEDERRRQEEANDPFVALFNTCEEIKMVCHELAKHYNDLHKDLTNLLLKP